MTRSAAVAIITQRTLKLSTGLLNCDCFAITLNMALYSLSGTFDRSIGDRMTRPLRFAILFVAAAAAQAQQPASKRDARVEHSRDSLAAVETSVYAQPRPLSRGDSVELIVTATNHGAARVQIGIACGPSLDVIVQYPDGTERSALWDSVGPNADFTCEGRPSHWAEPGQVATERILWHAPAHPGTYHLRAALRRGDGLGNLSRSISLTLP